MIMTMVLMTMMMMMMIMTMMTTMIYTPTHPATSPAPQRASQVFKGSNEQGFSCGAPQPGAHSMFVTSEVCGQLVTRAAWDGGTRLTSRVAHDAPHVTLHTSHVTRHTSHVTRHMSHTSHAISPPTQVTRHTSQ